MTKHPPLLGKRIILRPLQRKDAAALVKFANDKLIALYTRLPYPYRLQDAVDFIPQTQQRQREEKSYELGIELKETKEIIGMMSIRDIDSQNKSGEVGYWIGRKYWKQGLGSEALQLMIRFGFNKLKLKRLCAKVLHPNRASASLLVKYGFVLEGRMRKDCFKYGKWYDHLIFGLLREDYLRTKRRQK